MTKRRILFFAEAVTLAHLARPMALAKGLDPASFEAFIACDARYDRFLHAEAANPLPLHSIASMQFLKALQSGSPVYDLPTLRRYVQEDLALIERVRPDFIVGDFRLSLSVSARLAQIPYAAITNAYWSPYYRYRGFPLPVLPLTRRLPLPVAAALFQVGRRFAFPAHCDPLNRLRHENGLTTLGNDLRRIYTDADVTLYADDPLLFPTDGAPPGHHHIGPVMWSPPVPEPTSWQDIDTTKPTIYLTLGSSGAADVAGRVLQAVGELDLNIIAAGVGAALPAVVRARTFVSDYVPGEAAAARSQLVICNGGSPTSQQALAAGVPVLGIASNMDQFLNMEGLVRAGVGRMLRADRVEAASVVKTVAAMLSDSALELKTRQMATTGVRNDNHYDFETLIDKFVK